jgi:hypothetical protein
MTSKSLLRRSYFVAQTDENSRSHDNGLCLTLKGFFSIKELIKNYKAIRPIKSNKYIQRYQSNIKVIQIPRRGYYGRPHLSIGYLKQNFSR